MVLVPTVLLIAAVVFGLIGGAVPGIERAAGHFRDQASYIGWVLHAGVHLAPVSTSQVETYDYLYGAGAAVGAVLMAAVALFGETAQVTAFPGDHRRDLATLEATAASSARKLASVYRRNPAWVYQGETVAAIVKDATSSLDDCGLHAARAMLGHLTH